MGCEASLKRDYMHIGVHIQTSGGIFLAIAFLDRIAYLTSEPVGQCAGVPASS
jgi:hypothetical protein